MTAEIENLALKISPPTVGAAPDQNIGLRRWFTPITWIGLDTVDLRYCGAESKTFSFAQWCKLCTGKLFQALTEIIQPMHWSVTIATPKSGKPDINDADPLKYPGKCQHDPNRYGCHLHYIRPSKPTPIIHTTATAEVSFWGNMIPHKIPYLNNIQNNNAYPHSSARKFTNCGWA